MTKQVVSNESSLQKFQIDIRVNLTYSDILEIIVSVYTNTVYLMFSITILSTEHYAQPRLHQSIVQRLEEVATTRGCKVHQRAEI